MFRINNGLEYNRNHVESDQIDLAHSRGLILGQRININENPLPSIAYAEQMYNQFFPLPRKQ